MCELLTYFNNSSFDPSSSQTDNLKDLYSFISKNNNCYVLNGMAGSGKTSIIAALAKYLIDNNQMFRLMAPTGRAARVLYEITRSNAYTIHKSIYSLNKIADIKNDIDKNSDSFKYYFSLQENTDPSNTIYIVDEASMVSDQYSDNEFFRFGSGRLLSDLIMWSEINHDNNNRKIIFVGDSAQLPPVNMNFSPALDANYLKRTQFINNIEESFLDEVVRQSSDSGILKNANNIRKKIDGGHYSSLKIEQFDSEIIPIKHGEIISNYIPLYEKGENPVIIAYSNSSIYEYNALIRHELFENVSQIQVNDKVLIAKNNYKYGVLNGEFGKVIEMSPQTEEIPITLKKKKGPATLKLKFRDVTIETTDLDNEPITIQGKIIENILKSKKSDLSKDETRALYVNFLMRNRAFKPGSPDFKAALRTDPYFNALQIKYGYAITCHKAQGGEWDHAFIDFSYSHSFYNKDYYQWCYTAITRCKKQLYLLNQPNITPYRNMEVISSKKDISLEELDETLNEQNVAIPEHFELDNGIQKGIYILINDHLNNGFNVKKIIHFEWRERYTFNDGTVIDLIYNKNKKISIIKIISEGVNAEDIFNLLNVLKDKIIISAKRSSVGIDFPSNKPYLKEFYQQLNKIIVSKIQITNIEHLEYCERYYFSSDSKQAVVDYYYDGKGRFTMVNPQENLSTSQEMLDNISAISSSLNSNDR